MKPALIAVIVVVVLGTAGYAYVAWQQPEMLGGMAPRTPASANSNPEPAPDAADTGDDRALPVRRTSAIMADAIVIPARHAALSLAVPGIVGEVLAAEGETVGAGQVIARLRSSREVIAVAQAQSAVSAAGALVDQLSAGARAEEIAAAEAAVDAAQAQLDLLLEGTHPEDIAALEAALAGAQAAYAYVAAGANQEDLIAAQAELANAQALVTQAQRAYDLIAWRTDIGTTAEAATLQTTTNELQAAQARYNMLAAGADVNELAQAAAAVAQAQAALDRAIAPPTAAQIAAAEAEVRRAQAGLDLALAGARPEELLAAQAALAGAEATLLQAQYNLTERELTAPFTGTIAMLDLRVGQQAGTSLPIAQLADTSSWLGETTDLNEIAVVDLAIGGRALVTVDALPDEEFEGTIINIRPMGEILLVGDTNYRVTIRLDEWDPRLRWNMKAAVTMKP